MMACENGYLDIVRVLVEKQANVNHRNEVMMILILYDIMQHAHYLP